MVPSEGSIKVKSKLHERNRNREPYDLSALVLSVPELKNYLLLNKYGGESIDFSDPKAVKLLNIALLHHYYGIQNWDFPDENLCPPIPGRADYVHYLADLLAESNGGEIPTGSKTVCLDIGTGASCIYPVIAVAEYGWQCIASDIDSKSVKSARQIVTANSVLVGKVDCRLQKQAGNIFKGILKSNERIDVTICNPPFHASAEAAMKGSRRKVSNLSGAKPKSTKLNFSGINNELICEGGETQFIQNMIIESKTFANNCLWFSTLVSKQSNLKTIYKALKKQQAVIVKTIPMGTGNKVSRIVAWSFLNTSEHSLWFARENCM